MRTLLIAVCAAFLVNCSTLAPHGSATGERHDGTGDFLAAQPRETSSPTSIPDGDPDGLALGPVKTADDGRSIEDVGLCLDIYHGCTGDLCVWLCYDSDNDGTHDARAPVEFYRGRLGGYEGEEPFADPKCLDGQYFFRGDVFSVFDGLNKGGSFHLVVSDTLGEYIGQVRDWTVHLESTSSTNMRALTISLTES
jgi:subtilisin-like proprotein convertase family protein